MRELVESVRENGVIELILCHLYGEDGYQIVSGHRRQMVAILTGLKEVPVTVWDMYDHTATIVMMDSNLHMPTYSTVRESACLQDEAGRLGEKTANGINCL